MHQVALCDELVSASISSNGLNPLIKDAMMSMLSWLIYIVSKYWNERGEKPVALTGVSELGAELLLHEFVIHSINASVETLGLHGKVAVVIPEVFDHPGLVLSIFGVDFFLLNIFETIWLG